jgi:hypothetical protein
MQMHDHLPRGFPDIDAEIVPCRMIVLFEIIPEKEGKIHDRNPFFGGRIKEPGHMPEGYDEHMSPAYRTDIPSCIRKFVPEHDPLLIGITERASPFPGLFRGISGFAHESNLSANSYMRVSGQRQPA